MFDAAKMGKIRTHTNRKFVIDPLQSSCMVALKMSNAKQMLGKCGGSLAMYAFGEFFWRAHAMKRLSQAWCNAGWTSFLRHLMICFWYFVWIVDIPEGQTLVVNACAAEGCRTYIPPKFLISLHTSPQIPGMKLGKHREVESNPPQPPCASTFTTTTWVCPEFSPKIAILRSS